MFGRKFYVAWEKFEEMDREYEFWRIVEDGNRNDFYDVFC